MGSQEVMTSLNLITPQKPHLLIPSYWASGFQQMNLGETRNPLPEIPKSPMLPKEKVEFFFPLKFGVKTNVMAQPNWNAEVIDSLYLNHSMLRTYFQVCPLGSALGGVGTVGLHKLPQMVFRRL